MKKKKAKKKIVTKKQKLTHKKEKSKVNKKKRILKTFLGIFLVCCAIGIIGVFAFCFYIVSSCGEFNPNALANQDQTVIYDKNNNIIAKLGIEKRESVSYNELPEVLIDAIIATEDSRYFQHNGVDGARFIKASIGQILGNSDAGGASTLTMQVVKNNLTSREQSIIRKFKDVYLAMFFMEKKYTKAEIIEFYVNDSLLGGNIYGVEEASKYYFGKSVSDLSLPEAAIIAGLFQSPNGYNPYYYPEKTAKRLNTVLKLMVRHGYITQEEADIAGSVDIPSLLAGIPEETKYQGYIDTVVEEVIDKTGFDPALVSMEIYTTMDPTIQDGINKVLAGDGYTWKDDKVQAGITIIEVDTGAISAIGNGRNRTVKRGWNYATQTERQPGSTAKPLFAYAPGFEFDNFSTYQLFVDEQWHYTDGTNIGNWDSGYKGLMTLRDALSVSRNIPALKAFQTVQGNVGNKKIVEFVEGLGIKLKDGVAYESYSIGGMSDGVTTVQMAASYAAFANGGYYTEPYTVKSIIYRENEKTIEFEHSKKQAMKDSTAYLITNVLEHAVKYGFHGGTKQYNQSGGTVAAKTGTSNYPDNVLKQHRLPANAVNDLWTVAYTPKHSIALWYGYDEVSNEYYSTLGTPKDNLMTAIMKYIPVTNEPFKQPSSVIETKVESETWPAKLPSEHTPQALIKTEYFISGTEPTETSERFSKLNNVTNVKTTKNGNGTTITWDHNVPDIATEKYLKEYFNQPVFGNSGTNMLNERINYNNNILGGLGYGIYLQNGNDLKLIDFTTDKNYTYKGTNGTIIIKTEYRNFKNNASDGTSIKITSNENITNNNNSEKPEEDNNKLILKFISDSSTEINEYKLNSYKDEGIIATYNNIDITKDCKITYSLYDSNNKESKFTTKELLAETINKITEPNTELTIKYKVSYTSEDNKTISKTINKKIKLK